MVTIPTATLEVEARMTNPPKPIGFHVLVGGHSVAILDYQDVKRAFEQYEAMLAIHGRAFKP